MKTKTTTAAREEHSKEKNQAELSMKKKMLEVTFSQIDKQYGSGAVMKLGESNNSSTEAISTGPFLLIVRLVLVVCQLEESLKFLDQRRLVKQH